MKAAGTPFAAPMSSPLAGRTILQIIPDLDAGGAERTTIDIAAALADAGARALVMARGGRLISELQAKGGVWLPFPAATKNPLKMFLNARRLARIIREEGIDIVHARSRAPAWVAYLATRRTGTPFVTTYHGAYSGRSAVKVQYNSVMARGDVVIANSDYTADLITRLHGALRPRLRVIHRGTDFRTFSPQAVDASRIQKLRADWRLSPQDRVVLLPGRLTGWKGQKVLIEAARLRKERDDGDTRYILAGDDQGRGSYVKELDALIEKTGLTGIVRRVGHCTDMPAAYVAANCVVVASTEPEAFGRVAVEAQALGTPVIVTDLGAVPETVLAPPRVPPHERTGWTVPPGDAGALADALDEVIHLGATARDTLALRQRAHVVAHFSLDRMVRDTLDTYVALLEEQYHQSAPGF